MSNILLRTENLKKLFTVRTGLFSKEIGVVHAVDGISIEILRGETFGLVGETGSGKTTFGRLILRLMESTEGKVFFDGINVFALKKEELRTFRKDIQIIFQDPFSSLNPRRTIGDILSLPLKIHKIGNESERKERVLEILEKVGFRATQGILDRHPHEFSGGQKQRIGIARAIITNPKFIVCDEPVSSLDISIQGQILNLLKEIKETHKLTYLFIAHNLVVIKYMCDRVLVIYLGKPMELATVEELFASPKHPYTEALISAIPIPDPLQKKKRIELKGGMPSPINPPSGCRFHPRCIHKEPICEEVEPKFMDIGNNHFVACHIFGKGEQVG